MDFLSKAGISIDTATNKIKLGKSKLTKGKTYSVYPVHNWHNQLSDFQLISNSTISKSRAFSPFFLTFFRTGNYPFKDLKQAKINLNESSNVAEHFNQTRQTLQLAASNVSKAFSLS